MSNQVKEHQGRSRQPYQATAQAKRQDVRRTTGEREQNLEGNGISSYHTTGASYLINYLCLTL